MTDEAPSLQRDVEGAPRHTPWDGSHPLFRIGLAPLDPADWIEPDGRLVAYLDEKERLLSVRRQDVFADAGDTLKAQAEALALLRLHLAQRPSIWREGADGVEIVPAGRTVALDGEEPLVVAARLVQEDLVLMMPGADGWRLAAGCVCFPSSWRLSQKAGLPLSGVHAPVPGFGPGSRNASLIDRIFDNLRPEMPVWRMNWSLYPDDALFHGDETGEQRRSGELASTFLRVERQTLRKLPVSGAILFTIRIHLDPARLIARHPERRRLAAGLAAQLRGLGEAELAYKGMTGFRDGLAAELEAIAQRS